MQALPLPVRRTFGYALYASADLKVRQTERGVKSCIDIIIDIKIYAYRAVVIARNVSKKYRSRKDLLIADNNNPKLYRREKEK